VVLIACLCNKRNLSEESEARPCSSSGLPVACVRPIGSLLTCIVQKSHSHRHRAGGASTRHRTRPAGGEAASGIRSSPKRPRRRTGFTLLLVLLFLSPLASAGSLVRSLRPRVLEISAEGSVFLFPKIWRVVLEILVAFEWILAGRRVLVYLVAPIVFAV